MSQTTKELNELMEKLPETVRKQIYDYAQGEAQKLGIGSSNGASSASGPSFFDVCQQRGIVGMVKGGAPDLSTNPDHMEGFG